MVRLAVIDKLAWIKLQRSKSEQQPRRPRQRRKRRDSKWVPNQDAPGETGWPL